MFLCGIQSVYRCGFWGITPAAVFSGGLALDPSPVRIIIVPQPSAKVNTFFRFFQKNFSVGGGAAGRCGGGARSVYQGGAV